MNKKYMYSVLVLLAVGLVSAGVIQFYGQVSQEIIIESPIMVSELVPVVLSGIMNSPKLGGEIIVENKADFNVDVKVESVAMEGDVVSTDIVTSYVGELVLTKKNTDTWVANGESTIKIGYTVVGDTFEYEVLDGVIPSGYELVYAMDKENRFNNYATVKTMSEITESLPMEGDWNANAVPGYCNGDNTYDNYDTCVGAKLWIIPTSDIESNGVLSWVNMANYYYETDLINYFKVDVSGNTVIPEGVSMEFMPMYEFGAITGDYTVTTTVAPVTA